MAGSSTEILESNSSLDPAIFGDALLRDMAKLWIRTLDGRSGQRRRPSPALLAAARQWQTSQEQQRRRRQQQQQQQQQRRPAPDPAAPPPAHAENPRCWHKCSLGGEIRVLALSTEAGFAEVHAAACAKFGVSEDWRLLCRDAADAADERGADPPLITLLSDDDLAYARHRQPSLFFELAPPRDPLCSLVDVSRMSRASSSALDASSLGLSTLDEDPRTPSASGAPSALSPTPLLGAADLENDESLVTAFSALLQMAQWRPERPPERPLLLPSPQPHSLTSVTLFRLPSSCDPGSRTRDCPRLARFDDAHLPRRCACVHAPGKDVGSGCGGRPAVQRRGCNSDVGHYSGCPVAPV